MPNNKWTDESIEDLLKDFPAIEDKRSKEEVYNRLVQKEKVQKRPKKWLPLLVAALAFITIGLLVASVINQNGIDSAQNSESATTESSPSSETTEEAVVEEAGGVTDAEESGTEESGAFSAAQTDDKDLLRTAVYEDSTEDQVLMTMGLTKDAFVIPVSFLIPEDQVEAVFGEETPSSLELYQEFAADIDETLLGFDEYHPYAGTFENTDAGIRHLLPRDHQYDLASASIGVYFNTLSETFTDMPEIEVVNEDESTAVFSEIGPVEPIIPKQKNIAYYAFSVEDGKTYLVPGFDMPFASASEGIEALATSPNDFYQATIPPDASFQVSETTDLIEVEFKDEFDLTLMNRLEAVRMIESLILTADAFDKEVKIDGLQPENWNGFDFTQALPVPVAPNLLEWPEQ